MDTTRIARLTTALSREDMTALVVVPGANLRYLTGLAFHSSERLTLALFPADGSTPRMVLPAMEVTRAREHTLIPLECYPWSDGAGPDVALQQALMPVLRSQAPGAGQAVIGVEYTTMRVMELRALERAAALLGESVPGMQVVDATPVLASLRMVKEQSELAAMAEAARIVEIALHKTIAHIRPGMTERQLGMIWTHEISAAGGEGESFPNIVASGPNSANPHHNNSDRPFQPGDLIILDGGAIYDGYLSDITRTVALGEPGDAARRIYDLVQRANAAGRAVLRPGITGEQIDQAARAVIKAGGYGDYFVHRTGHGLGLECHEPPYLVTGSVQPLAAGTTFTIEPGIYLPGVGGVRIEDDVVITTDGGQSLTSFERELIVLPVT